MIIIDDFLPREDCNAFAEGHYNGSIPHFVPFTLLNDLDPISLKLFNLASEYFNMDGVLGLERWSNVDQVTPVWHTDHDMQYYMKHQVEKYPRCTIVYYPYVSDDMVGGIFETEDKEIIPKTNRVLLFGPGVKHHIRPFTGKRVSVVYNPWDYNPHS